MVGFFLQPPRRGGAGNLGTLPGLTCLGGRGSEQVRSSRLHGSDSDSLFWKGDHPAFLDVKWQDI